MHPDPTVVGEADRPGARDDGILAAIIFVVVSVLLIATLPLASEQSAAARPYAPAPAATSRGAR
jgi:hypothetical protein